ncbi:MAG: hypothetical protein RSG86_07300, partial [Oscillospiraceae bacterium]
VCLGQFSATTFDELFEGTKALPWEELIPLNGQFPIKGHSLNSQLHAVPACQAIVKKAVAARLGGKYGMATLPETGAGHLRAGALQAGLPGCGRRCTPP